MKSYQQIAGDGTTDRATHAPASPAHTATPWAFVSPHPGQFAIIPENRQKHVTTHTLAYIRDFQSNDRANAARIVACVNACAGMTDPAAQIKALRDALEDAEFLLRKCGNNWKEAGSMADSMKRSANDAREALSAFGGEAGK